MSKAIFPGSFDPIHEGHIDIVKKATKLFDSLVVLVANNAEKEGQTPLEERYQNVKNKLAHFTNVEIVKCDTLTAHFAREHSITVLVRSARNDWDYKYELELAAANHDIWNELETVLIIPDYSKIDFSSRKIKQVGSHEV